MLQFTVSFAEYNKNKEPIPFPVSQELIDRVDEDEYVWLFDDEAQQHGDGYIGRVDREARIVYLVPLVDTIQEL